MQNGNNVTAATGGGAWNWTPSYWLQPSKLVGLLLLHPASHLRHCFLTCWLTTITTLFCWVSKGFFGILVVSNQLIVHHCVTHYGPGNLIMMNKEHYRKKTIAFPFPCLYLLLLYLAKQKIKDRKICFI